MATPLSEMAADLPRYKVGSMRPALLDRWCRVDQLWLGRSARRDHRAASRLRQLPSCSAASAFDSSLLPTHPSSTRSAGAAVYPNSRIDCEGARTSADGWRARRWRRRS